MRKTLKKGIQLFEKSPTFFGNFDQLRMVHTPLLNILTIIV